METDFLTPVPHEEAAAIIEGKPIVSRQVFDGLLPELRGRAFTITGVESANVLQRVRDEIAALTRGQTWDESKQSIIDALEPYLGEGAERRAELLLRTHGFQAFQASQWRVAQEDEGVTALQYVTMEDDHVRDSHRALNGKIVPKDDPFWNYHYPPWDWGCRCGVLALDDDDVAAAKEKDDAHPHDDPQVMEGPALRKMNEGTLIRDGQTFNILPPTEKKTDNPFRWNPDDLRLPLTELKKRYDPEAWQIFEDFAKNTDIESGVSVWDWLSGEELKGATAVKEISFSKIAEAKKWADKNMHPNNLDLSESEKESLASYQRTSSHLNSQLMAGVDLSEKLKQQVSDMDAVFDRHLLKQNMVVWHGSSRDWSKYTSGSIVRLESFLSTTLAENNKEFLKTAWIKIHVPQGARAFYMDKIAELEHLAEEVEILLSRGEKLKIISIEQRDGKTYIEAQIL